MEINKGESLTRQAMLKLSVVVRRKRKERKLTQAQLANSAGISPSIVRYIEQGRANNTSLYIIFCLSVALDGLDWWSIPETK